MIFVNFKNPIPFCSKNILYYKNESTKYIKRFFFSKFKGKKPDENKPKLSICTVIESGEMRIPILGLGTWQSDHSKVGDAVARAIETGYRHIDTSYLFKNQSPIGYELVNIFETGLCCRHELFVSAKLPHIGMCPGGAEYFLDKALRDLQLDYVDLYLIGFPAGAIEDPETKEERLDPSTDLEKTWKAMEELVDCSKARAIGVSNFNLRQVVKILSCARIPPSNVQVEMHLYCQQREIVEFCRGKNIAVTAYAPLGSPGLSSFVSDKKKRCKIPTPLTDHNVLEMAKKKNVLPSQVLLRHLIQLGVAVIPKSTTCQRIRTNADIFKFELDDCEMTILNSLDRGDYGRLFHSNVWQGLEDHPEYPF